MSEPAKIRLALAEQRANEARQRLSDTVGQLQARLDPRLLAEEAKQAGLVAARVGVDGARQNPGLVIGALSAATLLLGRHRIAALFARRKPNPPPPPEGM